MTEDLSQLGLVELLDLLEPIPEPAGSVTHLPHRDCIRKPVDVLLN